MILFEAREQIADLLSSVCDHNEWDDVIEEHFPGYYGVENIDVETSYEDIWVEWSTMTFKFKDATLSFDVRQYPDVDLDLFERGVCLASGTGEFTYSSGKIMSIVNLEIELYRQEIIAPKYNSYGNCWNIAQVIRSLRKVYPYPDTAELARWAGVEEATIKRWESGPKAHARGDNVKQLMEKADEISSRFFTTLYL
jgi:hypothetical protein